MHAAFLALGPIIWFYINSYLSVFLHKKRMNFVHFAPSIIFLVGAYVLRLVSGEKLWLFIYWGTQIHPIIYLFKSLKFLAKNIHFKNNSTNYEKIWLYSLLGSIASIVSMNILYFAFNFPFYLVTALLLIITVYLFTFLSFNNSASIISGKDTEKYKNLNLTESKVNLVRKKIDDLLIEKELYLNHQIKISDISNELNLSIHVVSSVINESTNMNFPQYINLIRIKKAQEKLIQEKEKKILTIALESGFTSLSAFNRSFKKISQMSPSDYRSKFLLEKST